MKPSLPLAFQRSSIAYAEQSKPISGKLSLTVMDDEEILRVANNNPLTITEEGSSIGASWVQFSTKGWVLTLMHPEWHRRIRTNYVVWRRWFVAPKGDSIYYASLLTSDDDNGTGCMFANGDYHREIMADIERDIASDPGNVLRALPQNPRCEGHKLP